MGFLWLFLMKIGKVAWTLNLLQVLLPVDGLTIQEHWLATPWKSFWIELQPIWTKCSLIDSMIRVSACIRLCLLAPFSAKAFSNTRPHVVMETGDVSQNDKPSKFSGESQCNCYTPSKPITSSVTSKDLLPRYKICGCMLYTIEVHAITCVLHSEVIMKQIRT